MFDAFATRHDRRISFALLGACGALLASAAVVGIGDHAPGIALTYLAATAFVLAFVHHWRTAKPFALLLGAAVVGFFALTVGHNLAHGLADLAPGAPLVRLPLDALSVAAFLAAVFICPPAVLIGVTGAAAMFVRGRRHRAQPAV